MRVERGRVLAQRALLVTGLACVSWYALATLEAALFQSQQTAAFERLRGDEVLPPEVSAPADANAPSSPDAGDESNPALIGLIEVPRLSISAPVMLGDDERTLDVAAGLLPDTPRPWQPGNSAVAAHRDGLFRPLRGVRIGDEIVMRTTRGDLRYRVSATRIVKPTDLSVLAPTETPTLTLITCYPFNYVGAAPKRFIVTAERIP